jgi:L-serine dehydratase
MGIEGETPEKVDTASITERVDNVYRQKRIRICGDKEITFDPSVDLVFHVHERLMQHSNGMRFSVFDTDGTLLATNEVCMNIFLTQWLTHLVLFYWWWFRGE